MMTLPRRSSVSCHRKANIKPSQPTTGEIPEIKRQRDTPQSLKIIIPYTIVPTSKNPYQHNLVS